MSPIRPGESLRILAVAVMVVLVVACGSGPTLSSAPAATPVVTTAPIATQEPTPSSEPPDKPMTAATASAAASTAANTFVSKRYRYALTLPPGSLLVGWHSADRAWNGTAALDTGGPFLDRTAIADGGIHMFGAPSTSAEEWFGRVEGNGIQYHRCTKAQNRRDASIGDAQAIAFTQACSSIETWARVAIFKDGYGVGMWLHPTPGAEVAGRDRALELLEGLEWLPE